MYGTEFYGEVNIEYYVEKSLFLGQYRRWRIVHVTAVFGPISQVPNPR